MDVELKLPSTVTVTVEKTTVAAPSSAVRLVSEWVLLTAICVAFAPATIFFLLNYFHVHCEPVISSIFLRCVYLTDADAAEQTAFWTWILWCAALQVAAAMLALHLPCRRRWIHHGIAFVALAAAIAGHCMYATVAGLLLTANPGYLVYGISCTVLIVLLAVGDVLSVIALLGGEDENQAAAAAGQGQQLPN